MKQKTTAICAAGAAISGFMFAILSLHFAITRDDVMFIPFAIVGFAGAIVMWVNRK